MEHQTIPEPEESSLPPKPLIHDMPEDAEEYDEPDEQEVPEHEFDDPDAAAADDTIDDEEADT